MGRGKSQKNLSSRHEPKRFLTTPSATKIFATQQIIKCLSNAIRIVVFVIERNTITRIT